MIYDADYIVEEKTIVRLFEKNGKKAIRHDTTLEPYIYGLAEEDISRKLSTICAERRGEKVCVKNVELVEKYFAGKKRLFHKITFRHPQDVPSLREEIKMFCKIYEYDIPFVKRFCMDRGIVPLEHIERNPLKVMSLDIEVLCHGAPNARRDPVIMISTWGERGKVFSWKRADTEYVEFCKDERDMFERFFSFLQEEDPEIILTYNGDNFDFPYIEERCRILRIKNAFLDSLAIKKRTRGSEASMEGIVHVDMYPIVRRTMSLTRYTLEDVYFELFGVEKKDIDTGLIPKYWEKEDTRMILAEYALSDAEATHKIGVSFLPLQYELCRIVGQMLFDISRSSTSLLVEYLLMRHAFQKNEVVPNKGHGSEGTYEGGFVMEPRKGLHEHVVVLDFKSLYPSIIITHNIDPQTIDCPCCKNNVAPTGHHFCMKKDAFIPSILKTLLEKRGEIKKKMKSDEDKSLYFQQWALKILANSFYGYLAYPLSRWYSKECAEATTAWGRQYLKTIMESAQKHHFSVIYGDTDSLFITMGDANTDNVRHFLEEVNSQLPSPMELEYEGYYQTGLFVTKKKYALYNGKILTRGLEIVRRDWSKIARDTQKSILSTVLQGNPQTAAEIIKDVTKRIKNGDVPIEDLVINTQLTMPPSHYKTKGAHVIVAERLMEEGQEVRVGDIISFLVKKGKGLIRDKAVTYEEFVKNKYEYDPDYYIQNQVMPAVMRIMTAFGYTEDTLKYEKSEQKGLEEWF
jgi:DNA polymerase I